MNSAIVLNRLSRRWAAHTTLPHCLMSVGTFEPPARLNTQVSTLQPVALAF